MSTEEKFLAAVEVVNSIPYDGTFEPSEEIMLKFYAYQMQATEGPCHHPKPFIWNTVARNRWSAWNELGDMPAETAMEFYVEELSKVIETMSYNEKIAKFISLMGSFYEVVSSEEVESQKPQKIQRGSWSEERIPNAIFENFESPTISDLYHIATRERLTDSYIDKEIREDNTCAPARDLSQSSHIVKYDHSESHSRVYSQSSLSSSSSSSSSEISNFDLLSDLSGNDSDVVTERETLHLFKNNRNCNAHAVLTKNDLFVLTFINLQSSMEDILEKLENLNCLAKKRSQELNCTNPENSTVADWSLNLTGTAFAILWPIVVEVLLG